MSEVTNVYNFKMMLAKIYKRTLLTILVLFTIIHIYFFLKKEPFRDLFYYLKSSREEQLTKRWREYYEKMSFIKEVTPDESMLIVSGVTRSFIRPKLKEINDYFLFPRINIYSFKEINNYKGPIYAINMKDLRVDRPHLKEYIFDQDLSVSLLKEGTEKRHDPPLRDFTKIKSNLLNLSLALIKLTLIFLSGMHIVSRYFSERSFPGFLMTSFLAGSIITTVFYIILSFLNITFTEPLQYLFLGILSIPGALALEKYYNSRNGPEIKSKSTIFAIILVSLFFVFLFLRSYFSFIQEYDAVTIWGAKAKPIFSFHNLRALKSWGAPQAQFYPPLLPILMSQMGIGGERAVKIIFPLFALCLYVNIYDEITEARFSSTYKILLPLLILFSVAFFNESFNGYADLALAVFILKSFTILPSLLKGGEKGNRGWLSLAVILSGVVLIRPEGKAYLFYIVFLVFIWTYLQRPRFHYLLYLCIPMIINFLWIAFVKRELLGPSFFNVFEQCRASGCLTFGGDISDKLLNYFKVTKNTALQIINPVEGMIPVSFFCLCLFGGAHLLKKYSYELAFIFFGFTGLLFFACFAILCWAVVFSGTLARSIVEFTRYFMSFVPIMFVIILKETSDILEDK